jgi:hypothetical protein
LRAARGGGAPPTPGRGGTARFRADPCAAVTVEQLTALGSAGGERGTAQGLVDT